MLFTNMIIYILHSIIHLNYDFNRLLLLSVEMYLGICKYVLNLFNLFCMFVIVKCFVMYKIKLSMFNISIILVLYSLY